MGYECHPETDQSIARERLEGRLLNRKIHIRVRVGPPAPNVLDVKPGSKSNPDLALITRMPRRLALPASAERTEFCIDLDVSIHGSRRQSTYSMCGKDDTAIADPASLFMRLRSGRLGGIIEILTDLTLDTPDVPPPPAPPRKVFIAFPYFGGLNWLNCPLSSKHLCGTKITTHLGAVFLPVLAFLDGVSRRQVCGHIRRGGGKGTNMDSICAKRRLTPHLSNIYFVNFAHSINCFFLLFFNCPPLAPNTWQARRGLDSSPFGRDPKLSTAVSLVPNHNR
jgi:hypothetical protein